MPRAHPLSLGLLALVWFLVGPAPGLAAGPAGWGLGCYDWRLSFSETDPHESVRAPAAGIHDVYVDGRCFRGESGHTAAREASSWHVHHFRHSPS